jgi:hypothetical protein
MDCLDHMLWKSTVNVYHTLKYSTVCSIIINSKDRRQRKKEMGDHTMTCTHAHCIIWLWGLPILLWFWLGVLSQDSNFPCSKEGKGALWWVCNGRVLPLYVMSSLYSSFRMHYKYCLNSHIHYHITLVFSALQFKVISLYNYWNGPLIASHFC